MHFVTNFVGIPYPEQALGTSRNEQLPGRDSRTRLNITSNSHDQLRTEGRREQIHRNHRNTDSGLLPVMNSTHTIVEINR